MRDDVCFPGHESVPEIPRGTQDSVWLPVVGTRGLVLITRDTAIRHKPGELKLLKDHAVRAVFLTGKQDMTKWDKLSLLVRYWDALERRVRKNGSGPWAISLTTGGFRDIPL